MTRKHYHVIALGGTFDHFHLGHQQFISFAASLANHLIIGVTNSDMVKSKPLASSVEPMNKRMMAVSLYCRKHNISHQIVELKDAFGPTITNQDIQALAVTEETIDGASKINEVRQKMRLSSLPVHIFKLIKANDGQPIASSRIRAGEINKHGLVYSQLLDFDQPLVLNNKARQYFMKLHGVLTTEQRKTKQIVCVVGDTSLEFFRASYRPYSLGVYDLKKQRQTYDSPYLQSIVPDYSIDNPAGEIRPALVTSVKLICQFLMSKDQLDQPVHLFIKGEEDLVAPLLVLLLPLNSYIYYGQPDKGMVEMTVTEKLKQEVVLALK